MTNIHKLVHSYIDNDISIKKMLYENLINISSLARKISKEYRMEKNMDAIISAIRRYENAPVRYQNQKKIYDLLKETKVLTRNKLSSCLIQKHQNIQKEISLIYELVNFSAGEILRIFELETYIKLIFDEKNYDKILNKINAKNILNRSKDLCEINLIYPEIVTKIPGVFALISQELANNEISIIDSMICHSEHLIILDKKDFQVAFETINKLTNKK